MKTIPSHAFGGCTGLTTVNYNATNCTGGYDTFRSAYYSLSTVNIGDNVTTIPERLFTGYEGLATFNGKFASADNRCLIIDDELVAFAPKNLTSYSIPNTVTAIGDYAFKDCSGLTSVTIPNSVTEIGYMAFYECTGLTNVTMGNSVTTIDHYAFYKCTGLTSISIPNSVTTIGNSAFLGCKGLTTITIPSSVTSISDYAFFGCKGLTTITIPSSVTSIGNYAFRGCSGLTTITIPGSVTSIGTESFNYCDNLKQYYVPSSNPAVCQYNSFGTENDGILYVPRGIADKYMLATGWKAFRYILEYDFAGVEDVIADKEVASVKYFNLAGIESDEPFDGMNVVITTYTDGTQNIEKIVK